MKQTNSKEELYSNVLSILSNLRQQYVLYKVNVDKNNSEKSFEVDFYEVLVNIFGEDEIINLNSSNIANFEEELSRYDFSITMLSDMLVSHFGESEEVQFNDENFTLERLKFMLRNKKGLEFLEKCRDEYNSSMIKKEILDSILNTGIPHGENAEKFFKLQVYDKLLKLGGEEIVSKIDFSSVYGLKENLTLNVNKLFLWIDNDLKEIEKFSSRKKKISKQFLKDSKTLNYLDDLRIERQCIKRQEQEKYNFKILLENAEFISKDNFNLMMKNLESSLINGIEIVDELKDNHAGEYSADFRKIKIKNDIPSVVMHEIFHAASTRVDDNNRVTNIGTRYYSANIGTSINEGITEYFTQELFKWKTPYVGYKPLVAIVKDLVVLYGEENILETYLNNPEKLENLMEKDGHVYGALLDMGDTYYKMKYDNSDLVIPKSRQQEVAKSQYEKICYIIEDIRDKRQRENPEIELPMCECRKEFELEYNFKFSIRAFFRNVHAKLKDKFSTKEKQVLLTSGEVSSEELVDGQVLNNEESSNNFRATLSQENFKSSFKEDVTKVQAGHSKEENLKKEQQSDIYIEK